MEHVWPEQVGLMQGFHVSKGSLYQTTLLLKFEIIKICRPISFVLGNLISTNDVTQCIMYDY
jgi:hypothetical protein